MQLGPFSLDVGYAQVTGAPMRFTGGVFVHDSIVDRFEFISTYLNYSISPGDGTIAHYFGPISATLDGQHFAIVPEPANWLLFIVGFGLIGIAMRARLQVPMAFSAARMRIKRFMRKLLHWSWIPAPFR